MLKLFTAIAAVAANVIIHNFLIFAIVACVFGLRFLGPTLKVGVIFYLFCYDTREADESPLFNSPDKSKVGFDTCAASQLMDYLGKLILAKRVLFLESSRWVSWEKDRIEESSLYHFLLHRTHIVLELQWHQ